MKATQFRLPTMERPTEYMNTMNCLTEISKLRQEIGTKAIKMKNRHRDWSTDRSSPEAAKRRLEVLRRWVRGLRYLRTHGEV